MSSRSCGILLMLLCILFNVHAVIHQCNLITKDRFWEFSTGPHNYGDDHCQQYGANYVSLHSHDDYEDVVNMITACDKDRTYIGVEISECFNDLNFTLKWSDNTLMNYSYINWCHGYPRDLCNKSIIHFNLSGSCFMNYYDKRYPAICGDPYQC